MNKKDSSYIDVLSPGYESKTVKEYKAGTDGQDGKAHEEEVAPKNNWGDDKRDAIGRAASKRKIARKLRRIAREIEAVEAMDEDYAEEIEEIADAAEEEAKGTSADEEKMEDLGEISSHATEQATGKNPGDVKIGSSEEDDDDEEVEEKKASVEKEAEHPINHDPAKDDPEANMSSQTGDEEWIDIGPGSFNDARDAVGKAS